MYGPLVFAGRRKASGVAEVEALVQELDVAVVPFGAREWHALLFVGDDFALTDITRA